MSGLLGEGSLPEGDDVPAPEAETERQEIQRSPLHVIKERKGRAGKVATIVEGFECSEQELQSVARKLKQTLGTGGSARGGEILIQGDVAERVREMLRSFSFGYKVK